MNIAFQKSGLRLLVSFAVMAFLTASPVAGQQVVDKTVAVVSDGLRTELITYSDLLWQMALQPNAPLETPRSEDLNQALQSLINQGVFALEAQRLPRVAPTEKEIAAEINRTLGFFSSATVFEDRLKQVGFDSIKDPAFERLIARRLVANKYTDFRFRSFVVVSADEETRYYRDVFVPDFRRRFPGLLMPTLDEKRASIKETLTEIKVAERIESFLDDAKRRVHIEILIEV